MFMWFLILFNMFITCVVHQKMKISTFWHLLFVPAWVSFRKAHQLIKFITHFVYVSMNIRPICQNTPTKMSVSIVNTWSRFWPTTTHRMLLYLLLRWDKMFIEDVRSHCVINFFFLSCLCSSASVRPSESGHRSNYLFDLAFIIGFDVAPNGFTDWCQYNKFTELIAERLPSRRNCINKICVMAFLCSYESNDSFILSE